MSDLLAKIQAKGWKTKEVAERWGIKQRQMYNITRKPKTIHFDAVEGLPEKDNCDHCNSCCHWLSTSLITLLDIEKELRECEDALSAGFRHISCTKDEKHFDLKEELGFLVNGKFLPVLDIIEKANSLGGDEAVFTLEAVASGLSEVAGKLFCGIHNVTLTRKNGRDRVSAENEGGHNGTDIDLEQLLEWIAENRPQQYAKFITESMMRDYT